MLSASSKLLQFVLLGKMFYNELRQAQVCLPQVADDVVVYFDIHPKRIFVWKDIAAFTRFNWSGF